MVRVVKASDLTGSVSEFIGGADGWPYPPPVYEEESEVTDYETEVDFSVHKSHQKRILKKVANVAPIRQTEAVNLGEDLLQEEENRGPKAPKRKG